jgi:hypothetical protein
MSDLREVKRAKFLHKRKNMEDISFVKTILDKFYYRINHKNHEIYQLKQELKRFDYFYNYKEENKTTLF